MKKADNILKVLAFSLLVIGVVSCGKDGSEGPLGPRGEKGDKGDQGAKGDDGTLLRYGNGAPSTSLGSDGDFYIDMVNNNLYGPKDKNSWGAATNIKGDTGARGATGATGSKGDKGDTGAIGATGATGSKGDKGDTGATGAKGADGSQFLSGTAVPTTQGKVGDFYFRTSTITLYGPKTSSGWGAGVSLKGEKGDKGDKGLDGRTILSGTSDPTVGVGAIGDFYINTNSYVLFGPKTASGWGNGKSILGATGATGAKGDKGDKGDTGATGARGATGAKGDKGDSYTMHYGTVDPTNAIGKDGDFFYNTNTKTLFHRGLTSPALPNLPGWRKIAQMSKTIQFTGSIQVPSRDNRRSIDFDLPFAMLAKSAVNVYLYINVDETFRMWYPLPGRIPYNNDFSVAFRYIPGEPNKTRLEIDRSGNGVAAYGICDLRIVVTEAEVFKLISKKVDFKDYSDVNRYFQLGN